MITIFTIKSFLHCPRYSRTCRFAIVVPLALVFLALLSPSYSSIQLPDYDYMYQVTTEEQNFLPFLGSRMPTAVKASVTYQARGEQAVLYEDYWFSNSQAVGCRRHKKISYPGGRRRVLIFLQSKSSSPSAAESSAGAKTVFRLFVEASIHLAGRQTIYVPDQSASGVISVLNAYHFTEVTQSYLLRNDLPDYSEHIMIFSQPSGQRSDLVYQYKGY
jgi:hypothetical protein